MTISVALAAYNGSQFLQQQVDSIISQLGVDDQLIISVDPSSDYTLEIAQKMASDSDQIRVYEGSGRGINANFERAMSQCEGDYIFLSDQDDVWCSNKLTKVMESFTNSGASLVIHDAQIVDQALNCISSSFFEQRGSKSGYRYNLTKNSYMGCCMAFNSNLKPLILPIPANIPMYDQWIGLLAEKHSSVYFLPEPLIMYRRHGGNATSTTHASPAQMLKWRKNLIIELNRRNRELAT